MILCSQAKLENDNKSVNVKRGLRAKVAMGYRPNMSPLGYLHDTNAPKGERRVHVDPVRAPIIKEMFEKIAYEGYAGRRVKIWIDSTGFTTRKGKKMSLSMIYRAVANPYYTGRFEFPRGSGKWFNGKHEPLITQKLFDEAQEVMRGKPRKGGVPKEFMFTKLITCGICGSGITAEEKHKRLKDGTIRRYVYYGCCSRWRTGCKQKYIREEKLTEQICKMINKVEIDRFATSKKIEAEIEKIRKIATMLGGDVVTDQLSEAAKNFDVRTYAKHVLKNGTREEKREILDSLQSKFLLKCGEISLRNN